MFYYLSPYIGSGRRGNPYGALFGKEAAGSIDLRPDCTRQEGYALLAHPQRLHDARVTHIADDLDTPAQSVSAVVGSRLGLSAQSCRIRELLPEILIEHSGGPRRWNSLTPTGIGRYEIWLDELVWSAASIAGGVTYAENFNKADAPTLGPDLTWTEVSGTTWEVVSNQAKCVTSGNDGHARAEHDTVSSNQFCQITVVTAAELGVGGPWLRYDSGADTGYVWNANVQAGVNEHAWAKWVAGAETYPIGTISATDVTNGEILRGEASGSTLTGKIDGAIDKQITDTSITTGTRCGLRGVQLTGTFIVDTFSFGDLTASGLLSLGVGS